MMLNTPPDKRALEKRLDRFFNGSTTLRNEVYDFLELFLSKNAFDVYVFGGVVRDIGLFSVREFYSDIDLVVDTTASELDAALRFLSPELDMEKNKFGGYRIY